MADKNYEEMTPYQLKKLAKEKGIDVTGKKKPEIIKLLEGAGSKGSKGAKGSKGSKAAKGSKGAKGAKGGKSGREAAPLKKGAKGAKGSKGSKGGKAKAEESESMDLDELIAGYQQLRQDVDDLAEGMAARVAALEEQVSEGGSRDDDDDEGGEGPSEEALEALADFIEDGALQLTADDFKKLKKPQLKALAECLGVEMPTGSIKEIRAELQEAYEEADGGDDDDDDADDASDAESGDVLELEIGGEEVEVEAIDDECFDPKFWKKGGQGHKRRLAVLDSEDDENVWVTVKKVATDADGDAYLEAESEDGEDFQIYGVGADSDAPLSAIGLEIAE